MTDKDRALGNLPEELQELLGQTGPIAKALQGFEVRKEQQLMAQDVLEAYHSEGVALIEAGTGTGKSLAYLLPAILWALETKEKTVISTNTIPLQEQLLYKDIPLLQKVLGSTFDAALCKGMNNYLCLRKLEDLTHDASHLNEQDKEAFEIITGSKEQIKEGSKSELPIVASHHLWEQLGAEWDACSGQKCPHYKECYYFKARDKAKDAQLLIVNHHLLFADLAWRKEGKNYDKEALLPPYSRLIIDEAHNVEEVATEHFATSSSRLFFLKQLGKLGGEKKFKGKLAQLKERIQMHFPLGGDKKVMDLLLKIDIDLSADRRILVDRVQDIFDFITEIFKDIHPLENTTKEDEGHENKKWRLSPKFKEHAGWEKELKGEVAHFADRVKRFSASLAAACQEVQYLDGDLDQKTKGLQIDIQAIADRLSMSADALYAFVFANLQDKDKVHWAAYEPMGSFPNVSCYSAQLESAPLIREHLFEPFKSLVLCSATMTAAGSFSFIKEQLDIKEEKLSKKIIEKVYPSPFNFKGQALFATPSDMPLPESKEYPQALAEEVFEAIKRSQGGAFVLFTSFSALKGCYEKLAYKLKEMGYKPLRQGQANRKALLEEFRSVKNGILFGTDSFWEGVDVVGDALRLVIIAKLPFKVPTEPLIQARCERIEELGESAFMKYALPQAIVKFKQGFGRLIRHREDRGCVLCLDSRLVKKNYGKLFLKSLPDCSQEAALKEDVRKLIWKFFQNGQK